MNAPRTRRWIDAARDPARVGETWRAATIWALLLLSLTTPVGRAQQLAVATYTSEDGPAHPQVWTAYQDSRGYLWLGTSEGLSRWDGVAFQSFTAVDGLHDLTVRTITEDAAGDLWLGTDHGISRFDGLGFIRFGDDEGVPEDGVVWAAVRDGADRLWFGTQHSGVVRRDRSGVFQTFSSADGLASDYVYSLLVDRDGRLWLGHRGRGLSRCAITADGGLEDCRVFTTADGLGHDEIRALAEDADGRIWIGTRGGGLSRFEDGAFTTFTTADGLAENDIYAVLVNHDDQVVVGSVRNGISICTIPDLGDCRSYGMRNGLADDAVLNLYEDREGNLWVALSNGLSQLWTEDVESYTLRDGLPHPTVYSILMDDAGAVWAGTLDGLARIDHGEGGTDTSVQAWESEGRLPGHEVWEMCRDTRGWMWVATEGGLCRFERGRCDLTLTADDGLADSDLYTVFAAADGSVWAGTVNGVSRVVFPTPGGPPVITSFSEADGLPAASVRSIAEDHRGHVWFATDNGLTRWDGDGLRSWGLADGLPTEEMLSLAHDHRDRLWVGTSGAGLVEVDLHRAEPRFESHGPDLGIPEVVGALLPVGDTLWLGTGDGAFLYAPDLDPPDARILERLDTDSGLPGLEVNAMLDVDPGVLWLATSGGLTRLNLGHDRRRPEPPRVRIERVHTVAGDRWRTAFTAPSRLQDPEVRWLEEHSPELGHDFAAVRFDFRSLFFGPHQRRFQVRLEGFDDGWSAPFSNPFKEYTNLDPGPYTFHVRSSVTGGEWGPDAELAFRVVPAWWQTTWARGGFALGLIGLVALGVRLRTASIRRQARELERAVAERTDDLNRYARALEDHSVALDWANVEIRHADRVKSEFLANMSHELRTPLNSIIGFSDVLARRLDDRLDERELKFLRNVSRSGRYLLLLINNLLDLSKIEADRMDLHLERVDLPRLLDDTLKVVHGYASDRSVEVEVEVHPDLAEVEVDVAKFNQILINLLSNAVKFSRSGDTVEVATRPVAARETPLNVPCYEISVTDHGPGIPDEDRAIIFDVFCQGGGGSTHPGGTGLGLALVQKYVTMMGGQVDFRSSVGEGSTFWVVLPVSPAGQRPVVDAEPLRRRPEEPLRRPCVLIVDHDRRHFATMAPALEQEGLLPVRAGDAGDALRMVEGLRPSGLIVLWDAATAHDWTSLAPLLGPAARLPLLIGLQVEGSGPATLAADVCLTHPLRADQLQTVTAALAVDEGATVLIAGADAGVEEGVRSALAELQLDVEPLDRADEATLSGAPLAILDLTGRHTEAVLTAVRRLPRDTPRVILLPTRSAPGLTVLAEGSSPPPTELALEMKVLLARRSAERRSRVV